MTGLGTDGGDRAIVDATVRSPVVRTGVVAEGMETSSSHQLSASAATGARGTCSCAPAPLRRYELFIDRGSMDLAG